MPDFNPPGPVGPRAAEVAVSSGGLVGPMGGTEGGGGKAAAVNAGRSRKDGELQSFLSDLATDDRRRRQHHIVRATMYSILILAVFLGGWEATYKLGIVKPIFVSDPASVARSFASLMTQSNTWVNVWSTFKASVAALGIGSAAGIVVGVAITKIPALRTGARPFISLTNAIPRPAIAPILILWFGLGFTAKALVGASLVFFILLLNTVAGMDAIDPDIVAMARSLGMTQWQMFRKVEVPASADAILAGLRLGAVAGVLGVVVSELVSSYRGLGQAEVQATDTFNIAGSFAILFLMGLLAVSMDLVIGLVERWWRSR